MTPKKIVGFLIKLGFIVMCFVVIFRPETVGLPADTFQEIEPGDLIGVIKEVNAGSFIFWIGFAFLIKTAGIFAGITRWKLLLYGQGITMPYWYLTKSWFMGRAIGLFLPGTLGLDGYRLVESAAYTREPIKCATVIAVEKLIGIIALFSLVFITLPLGLRFFSFNPVVLAIILSALFVIISTAMLILMNPRIVRVLVAVVPTPAFIRNKVNKLGIAITAYGGHRRTLLIAVGLGLCVHLGTCLMYFGTAMAIAGGEVALLDTLFASPLVIVGSVLTPTVSGLGVREVVFGYVLGFKVEAAKAVTVGHLGLWAGEVLPFVLSLPLLLFTTRPNREHLLQQVEEARSHTLDAAAMGGSEEELFAPEKIRDYRMKLVGCILAGIFGGLFAGALIGLGEAHWNTSQLDGLKEFAAYWWGPIIYADLFAGVGLGVAGALLFFYLLFDRFLAPAVTYGLSAGGALGAGILIIGKFRYTRDVLDGHAMSMQQNLMLLVAAAVLGFALAGILAGIGMMLRNRSGLSISAAVAAYLAVVGIGFGLAGSTKPNTDGAAFISSAEAADKPNVILIAIDTLRADYLRAFNESATPTTPHLDAFAADATVQQKTFAQSSWTKPSFATMFSAMYPSSHTAVTKTSALPDEIVTFPEVLKDAGYYTKGFANNPNITSVFNFDQGFVDYVDLKPDLYFGASASASKLSMYEVLRRIRQMVEARLTGGRLRVTDFYQPAESVTATGLDWLDSGERPGNAPFFLFLHYMDPHDPFMDWSQPGVGYARVRLGDPDPAEYKAVMEDAYRQEIEYMDVHLGALFDGLRERGLYDNTLIVFTSDHGEEFYEHEGWWHGQTLYDELIHIPLIMKLPAEYTPAGLRAGLAQHVDIGPSVLDVAGVAVPENAQGSSIFQPGEQTFIYAEVDFEGNDVQALRTDKHKLLHANEDSTRGFDIVEFYSLEYDPKEQENIAGQNDVFEAILEKGMDDMENFINDNAAQPMVSTEIDEETMENLEALGYLE